jgi:hypothetical protein
MAENCPITLLGFVTEGCQQLEIFKAACGVTFDRRQTGHRRMDVLISRDSFIELDPVSNSEE